MRLILLSLFFFPLFAQGQEDEITPDDVRKMEFSGVFKSSISVELGGKSGFIGVSYDRLLSSHSRIGVGAGYSGVGLDFKYYPRQVQRDKWLLNIGLRANMMNVRSNFVFCSLPIGFSFFGLSRLNFDFDLGPMYKLPITTDFKTSQFSENWNYVWFSAKVGYRFSYYAMKRARRLNQAAESN